MAVCPPETVIAGAVGDRLVSQRQGLGNGKDRARRRKLGAADDGDRQMVSILTCVLTDGLSAVESRLPGSARAWRLFGGGDPQHPGPQPRSGAPSPWLMAEPIPGKARRAGRPVCGPAPARGIVDDLVAAERACVLTDDRAILADDDAVGISMDLDRPTDGARQHRVFVVVEAHRAGLRHRRGNAMVAVEATGIGNEAGAFFFEYVPDRALTLFGMPTRLGIRQRICRPASR